MVRRPPSPYYSTNSVKQSAVGRTQWRGQQASQCVYPGQALSDRKTWFRKSSRRQQSHVRERTVQRAKELSAKPNMKNITKKSKNVKRNFSKNIWRKQNLACIISQKPHKAGARGGGGPRLGWMAKGIRNSLKELRYSSSPFTPIDYVGLSKEPLEIHDKSKQKLRNVDIWLGWARHQQKTNPGEKIPLCGTVLSGRTGVAKDRYMWLRRMTGGRKAVCKPITKHR